MRNNVILRCMILATLMLCLLLSGSAMADTKDFTFKLNAAEDGYVVTGYSGSEATVTVPDWYNSLPVTEVGASAFQGNTALKTVKLPSSLERIGAAAFKGCKNLAKVTDYPASAEPPTPSHILGDVDSNGQVNARDVLLVMQFDAGWDVSVPNADVTKDGIVDLKDAVHILKYCAGEISSLE